MKQTSAILIFVSFILGVLWLAYGGLALAIALGMLVFLTCLLLAFGLGSWWSSQLMERGARIALQAQSNDDRRDMVQMRAMSGLVKEVLKVRNIAVNDSQYPALPIGEETVEGTFTVSGLEEEA